MRRRFVGGRRILVNDKVTKVIVPHGEGRKKRWAGNSGPLDSLARVLALIRTVGVVNEEFAVEREKAIMLVDAVVNPLAADDFVGIGVPKNHLAPSAWTAAKEDCDFRFARQDSKKSRGYVCDRHCKTRCRADRHAAVWRM